ncbi:MAG: hypothetical protein IJJ74_01120 [Eubacterium sp.]|nr:hypothetical protein [Eubacterium sp.]MBR0395880.1 hypothetical protein [Clostridiales bacterium]
MKIHGHSTIELTNIHTGEVEKYENDNMVTNALNYYLQDVGVFNTSPIYTEDIRNNLIPRLLGGLLLLDTELTESADNIICPSGVKMVGNGAYGHSSGSESEVTEMGTYDQVESHWTSDGKCVMVWSFGTSQANCDTEHNQQIKCACLTSANHGYIGEGNANSGKSFPRSSTYRRNDYSLAGTPQGISIDGGNYQANRILRASRTSNTITMIDEHSLIRTTGYENEHMSETGKLKFVTYKMPIKKLDMRFGAGFEYIPTTEVEVSLASAFVTALNHGNAQLYGKVGDTYYLAVGFASTGGSYIRWNANSNIHVVRINSDNSASYYSVANPSDGNIDFIPNNLILVGNVLMVADNTGTWFVDVTNQADVTHSDLGAGAFDLVYPEQGVAFGDSVKVDIGERKVYYANLWRNSGNNTASYQFLSDNPLTNAYMGNGQLYKTTNYLATINNLQSPVVKTAEKTMKVTYVLSFDDGE